MRIKVQILEDDGTVQQEQERELPAPMLQELILVSTVLTHTQEKTYRVVDCVFGLLSAGVDIWMQDYAKYQLKETRGTFGIERSTL